eukprot:CAMPEP_0194049662 /NCGR_PEP_ID=MMETSP0009_2-20130614/30816_1 /TAXON_ID=210454 /ORGANISM="Grammatophora oceanica, Strain CCMP 410" /LENGTH=396 /DNA_ID=CAMNT_0038695869 /DNA_START=47 /DNA_END=1237 /DNA_ORIENTATION=-
MNNPTDKMIEERLRVSLLDQARSAGSRLSFDNEASGRFRLPAPTQDLTMEQLVAAAGAKNLLHPSLGSAGSTGNGLAANSLLEAAIAQEHQKQLLIQVAKLHQQRQARDVHPLLSAARPNSLLGGTPSAAQEDIEVAKLLLQQHRAQQIRSLASYNTISPMILSDELAARSDLLAHRQSSAAVDLVNNPNLNVLARQTLNRDLERTTAGLPLMQQGSMPFTASKEVPTLNPGETRATEPFPRKLHRMLRDLSLQPGGSDIASFLPHGRAFAIHHPKRFVTEVMPLYFRMSRFSSFQRQLNLYDFKRITEGRDKGSYYHELFVRGQPALASQMRRTKIKGVVRGDGSKREAAGRKPSQEEEEPRNKREQEQSTTDRDTQDQCDRSSEGNLKEAPSSS